MDIARLDPMTTRPEPEHEAVGFQRILGTGRAISEAVRRARALSEISAPLLIQGESGVGKEVFARAIHEASPGRTGPFVALNCGRLSRELLASELFGYVGGSFAGAQGHGVLGKLEAADGGTLFLDSISDLPPDLQPCFLRILEGGEFYPLGARRLRRARFRLLSACRVDLSNEVARGRFRRDLFYRMAVTTLRIPTLRERVEDLPLLIDHFAREVARRRGTRQRDLGPDVLALLAQQPWPGNLRELRELVESMLLLLELAEARSSEPPAAREQDATAWPARLPQLERHVPLAGGTARFDLRDGVLQRDPGQLVHAARELQIARGTLYLELKKYSLERVVNDVHTPNEVEAGGSAREQNEDSRW